MISICLGIRHRSISPNERGHVSARNRPSATYFPISVSTGWGPISSALFLFPSAFKRGIDLKLEIRVVWRQLARFFELLRCFVALAGCHIGHAQMIAHERYVR